MEVILPQPVQMVTSNVPAFLAKLWKMVDDMETNHLIEWGDEGNSFVIHNHGEFEQTLLPYYYCCSATGARESPNPTPTSQTHHCTKVLYGSSLDSSPNGLPPWFFVDPFPLTIRPVPTNVLACSCCSSPFMLAPSLVHVAPLVTHGNLLENGP